MTHPIRHVVRDLAAEVLMRTGLTRPRARAASRLHAVTFHRVLPEAQRCEYPFPGLAVTPTELAWLLEFLTRHFHCGTLRECATRWLGGERPGRPFLAVTFDDGQRDNFLHALPVLDRLELRGTFFVPVENVSRGEILWHDRLALAVCRMLEAAPENAVSFLSTHGIDARPAPSPAALARRMVSRAKEMSPEMRRELLNEVEASVGSDCRADWDGMMTWSQLKELAAAGHEIGSHSMTHALLPQLGDRELEREIVGSRAELERNIGASVDSFCYPNGDSDDRVVDWVRRAGYRFAVTTEWGSSGRRQPLLRLRRWDMDAAHLRRRDGALSEALLAWRVASLNPGPR